MTSLLKPIASRASFRKSGSCIINADHTATTHVLDKLRVALVFDEVNLDGCGDGSRGVHFGCVPWPVLVEKCALSF